MARRARLRRLAQTGPGPGGNAREACRLFFRATHFPDGAPTAPGAKKSDEPDSDADANDANDANANDANANDASFASPAAALARLYRFEDLKFPHDYYDQSARVEEETKRFAERGFPGAGAKNAARRRVALEMEDDTDESEEEGGDLPGHRDR